MALKKQQLLSAVTLIILETTEIKLVWNKNRTLNIKFNSVNWLSLCGKNISNHLFNENIS